MLLGWPNVLRRSTRRAVARGSAWGAVASPAAATGQPVQLGRRAPRSVDAWPAGEGPREHRKRSGAPRGQRRRRHGPVAGLSRGKGRPVSRGRGPDGRCRLCRLPDAIGGRGTGPAAQATSRSRRPVRKPSSEPSSLAIRSRSSASSRFTSSKRLLTSAAKLSIRSFNSLARVSTRPFSSRRCSRMSRRGGRTVRPPSPAQLSNSRAQRP